MQNCVSRALAKGWGGERGEGRGFLQLLIALYQARYQVIMDP